LPKIPTRLRGTNFCTSSARCAPSFVRQPNGPECTQIVRNTPKRHFRVQWGGSGAFIAKKFGRDFVVRTFALVSARFAPSFVRQPNGPERTQIVRNTPKRHFRVQWGGSGAFIAKKIRTRLRGTNFCTSFGPFRTEFRKATKRSRMHPNSTKRTKTSF